MKAPDFFQFFSQAKIMSGKQAMENIPLELAGMAAHRPMVITDRFVCESGLLDKLVRAFYESTVTIGAVYDSAPMRATAATIEKGAALFKWKDCDSIIALGSGSVMDMARGVNMAISSQGSLADMAGMDTVGGHLKPFVAVMTSCPAGYEAGNEALIDNRLYKSDYLFPDIICIDKRMMIKQTPADIAGFAMMALSQAIEACQEPYNNPMSDAYALMAIRYVSDHLPTAVKKPGNKKSLLALTNASVAASIAFANAPRGTVHDLAVALSRETEYPAGRLMAILLPAALDIKMKTKAGLREDLFMALAGIDESSRVSTADRARASVERIRSLGKACGKALPGGLRELNIPAYKLENAAGAAAEVEQRGVKKGEFMAILEQSL